MPRLAPLFLLPILVLLTACAGAPEPDRSEIPKLAAEIAALGPGVAPEEAQRAARIAYEHPLQLAEDWQVTASPLVHNAKVRNGLREKGLCNDWAEAMITRLRQEGFETLELHWATSPAEGFRVIHHSAVITARGAPLEAGVLLDPWRHGGVLYWGAPGADPRYDWMPRMQARALRAGGAVTE
ncbi:hypothetical protein [Roseivivax sp.]